MAKSSERRVYLPQDMNVQLAASEEVPAGRVVQLKQGWIELKDGLENHPILKRLQEEQPGESERQARLYQAEQDYSEAVNKAAAELAKVRQEVAAERREHVETQAGEWADRREEAVTSGRSFNEPHPDLDTRRAMALTAPAAVHATVPADSFANTAVLADERRAVREGLPSEAENRERQQAAVEHQDAEQGGRAHGGRTRTRD